MPHESTDPTWDDALRTLESGYDAQCMDMMFKLIRRICFSIWKQENNPAIDPDDFTQESVIQIHRSLNRFYPNRGRLQSWCRRICHNVWVTMIRHEYSKGSQRTESIDISEKTLSTVPSSVDEASDRLPERLDIEYCIDRLSPKLREIFWLREIGGDSYEEISVRLGIKVGTVKERLHRARQSLQDCLDTRWRPEHL